jgi:hypothetical protein
VTEARAGGLNKEDFLTAKNTKSTKKESRRFLSLAKFQCGTRNENDVFNFFVFFAFFAVKILVFLSIRP